MVINFMTFPSPFLSSKYVVSVRTILNGTLQMVIKQSSLQLPAIKLSQLLDKYAIVPYQVRRSMISAKNLKKKDIRDVGKS